MIHCQAAVAWRCYILHEPVQHGLARVPPHELALKDMRPLWHREAAMRRQPSADDDSASRFRLPDVVEEEWHISGWLVSKVTFRELEPQSRVCLM